MAWRTSYEGLSVRCAEPLKPSRAAAMVPMVTAMCIHVRKVLSLAKKVLGSIRMGVVLHGDSRSECGDSQSDCGVSECNQVWGLTVRVWGFTVLVRGFTVLVWGFAVRL